MTTPRCRATGSPSQPTGVRPITFTRRCPTAADELKPLLVWGLLGTGILMTVAGVFVQRHYYLGLFPLPYVAFALALRTKSWLLVYVVAALQLIVSVAFLIFIHVNRGAPGAEFGPLAYP